MNDFWIVAALAGLMLAACGVAGGVATGGVATGPAGQASPGAVNPETGGRGASPR